MTIGYRSTRSETTGDGPDLGFADVLLSGLAPDGGLYCPVQVPTLDRVAEPGPGASYGEVATWVMWPYVEGSIEADVFANLVEEAYACFRHRDVCPVIELGDNHYLLDLTKGPTLAFKDVALQLVARLLDYELTRRHERVVVLTATSGDTGSAAIEALAGRHNVSAVVLHPHNRVSEVQRRQMTTVHAANIDNLAVEGSFDDCQDLVKAAFGNSDLFPGPRLAAVNSINWARVMAQIVYYVTAARHVAEAGQPVSFSVPTGNFGNILAGWYARRMGLAVDQLVVASNRNDVLTRYFKSGVLEAADVVATLSPSMDIQIPSNFERMLWEAGGHDGPGVARLIAGFRSAGRAEIPVEWSAVIGAQLDGCRVDEAATMAEMERAHDDLGLLIDPHTAVGLRAARSMRRDPTVPMITIATADPAKFPDAVERATGIRPRLPAFLAELFDREERYEVVPNELGAIAERVNTAGSR